MSESKKFSIKPWIIVCGMKVERTSKVVPIQAREFAPDALPDLAVCQRARQSRDPRFDGRFFIGVVTTGIYCRTTCPARMPKEENVRYYVTAAQAQEAGFRPCKRCRPEAAQRLPEWTIATETVQRALRYIEAGYLNQRAVTDLADELSVGERHLNRLFQQELGASVKGVAQLCRAKLARKLLADTTLPIAELAFHAGYGSVSRFNAEMKKIFQATPSALRNGKSKANASLTVVLPIRGPYDFDWMFEYLDKRSLVGIEEVSKLNGQWCYQRRLPKSGTDTTVYVRVDGTSLVADLPLTGEPVHSLLTRVRRVFDLNADGETVHESMADDEQLGEFVRSRPGLRVPGAWDGFETAVRAILGQQVSVERGTVLAGKLITMFGNGDFPKPEQLYDQDISAIGMPGRRGEAVRLLARQVMDGALTLDDCQEYEEVQVGLESLPGIGPWTANYIRMRTLKDPDAFPHNDWVVMKALGVSAAKAQGLAEKWRPWRAYALMYVWCFSKQMRAKH